MLDSYFDLNGNLCALVSTLLVGFHPFSILPCFPGTTRLRPNSLHFSFQKDSKVKVRLLLSQFQNPKPSDIISATEKF